MTSQAREAFGINLCQVVFLDTFLPKMPLVGLPYTSTISGTSIYYWCCSFTGKERDEETGYGYFGARYMDHELMTMWLSVDPLADKYPGISPYAYCVWNPVKLVDPDGRDWYRNDKTGSVFWSSKNDRKIEYNGESYRNIGTSYKTYKDGFIFQYGNSMDDVSISEVSESEKQFYMDGGQFIPSTFYTDDGTKVNVSFLYNSKTGGNGDKPLNPEMVSALIQAVDIVNNGKDKINKIDISTTTTGKHSKNSSHYICNGARAVDIDIINNTSLRKTSSHSLATKLQRAFDQLGVTNYGPAHNQREGHDNHIHANIKKKQ